MFEIITSKLHNNTRKTSSLQNLKKMSFNLENTSITTLGSNKRKLKLEKLWIEQSQSPIEPTMETIEDETVHYLKNTNKFSNLEAFLIELAAREFQEVISLNK